MATSSFQIKLCLYIALVTTYVLSGPVTNKDDYDNQTNPEMEEKDHKKVLENVNSIPSWATDVLAPRRRSKRSAGKPFTAMMFGLNHIQTFDGVVYQIPEIASGACVYQLAGSSVSNDFTAVVHRGKLSVITREIAVTIDRNNRVKLNNSKHYSDLPVQSWNGNVVVTRRASTVCLNSIYGFSAECDVTRDMCTFQISRHRYNSTVGLLGTNDHNQTTDFRLRDGTITLSKEDFLNTYEISGEERCRLPVRGINPDCPNQPDPNCSAMFEEVTSPLANCFQAINPRPFKVACEKISNSCGRSSSGTQENICTIMSGYIAMCQSRKITLSTPTECGVCNRYPQQWNQRLQNKLDLVLVLDTTIDAQMSRSLHSFLHRLKLILNNHVSNARIGVVESRFMRLENQPSSYTFNGNLFQSLSDVSAVTRHVRQRSTSIHDKRRDPLAAVALAGQYPFRTDASKLIVLITDLGAHLPNSLSQARKSEVSGLLQSNDIKFYIVGNFEFSNNGAVGMNWNTEVLQHSTDRVAFGTFPQGGLVDLVGSTRGLLFRLQSFREYHQHNHHQLLANKMRYQMASLSGTCQTCLCTSTTSHPQGGATCSQTSC